MFRKAGGKGLHLVFILIGYSWLTDVFTGSRTQLSGSLVLKPFKHRPPNPRSTSKTTDPLDVVKHLLVWKHVRI